MGCTNPTFLDVLRSLENIWQDYRRALRRPDQDASTDSGKTRGNMPRRVGI